MSTISLGSCIIAFRMIQEIVSIRKVRSDAFKLSLAGGVSGEQEQYNSELLDVYLPQTSSHEVRNIDGANFEVPFLHPSH